MALGGLHFAWVLQGGLQLGLATFRASPYVHLSALVYVPYDQYLSMTFMALVAQASLLDAAAGLVRVGGVLVYSTCSIENDENADQVKAFIKRQSGFREVSAKASCVPPPLIAEDGFLKIFQHRHDIEGAFAALLKRDHV